MKNLTSILIIPALMLISCKNVMLNTDDECFKVKTELVSKYVNKWEVVKTRDGDTIDYHLNTENITFELRSDNVMLFNNGKTLYSGKIIAFYNDTITVKLNNDKLVIINCYQANGLQFFKLIFNDSSIKSVELMTR